MAYYPIICGCPLCDGKCKIAAAYPDWICRPCQEGRHVSPGKEEA